MRGRVTGECTVPEPGDHPVQLSMAEPVRLRVMFGDAGLLKRSQQRGGLQSCLLQLRPDVATIADLAAQIHQNFGLHRSCPHGIIISMDDFVLPPFETTSILKDDDMIMINKNGVAFKDAVKFCGNQYQEQVLHRRDLAHSKKKLAIMDQIIDSIVGSEGDEDDMVLYDGSAVRMVTPQSEKMNARCKRKRSTELQSSDNTLAIKDSHGDSEADEEDINLHGKIKHKGATSNEMVNANCKKTHTNKFQASYSTLENKDSQADSQADKGHLSLPVRHKETSSGEMIQGKQNKKLFDKLLGSDGTLTVEDYQGNSQGDEHDDGLLGIIAHKEVTSNEMMNLKHNRKHLNKLQASNMLTGKNSHGNSQGDDEDLGLPNKMKSQEESPQCKMSNTKRKKKHSHCHQGSKSEEPTEIPSEITNVLKKIHSNKQGASDGTLTIEDSQGNSQRDEQDDDLLGIVAHKEATSNEMMDSKHKRKRLNKLQASNTLTSKNSQRDSQGDGEDLGLPNEKKSRAESPQCEIANLKRKKKPSHRHQGSKSEAPTETPSKITNVIKRIHSNKQKTSDGTLTIEDSQGKSKRNEHDDGLFGIIAHKEATSNEMMNSKSKRKHHNKLQASNMLTSNNSQVELHGDEVYLGLPTEKKSLEESPQCEMANTKRKKKHSHRHQGSNGTLTIEDSQENSQRDEHDEGILGIIAHKEATSNAMMNSKHKRKRLNTLQDSNTLTSKNSQGDSLGDDENLVLPNEKKSQEESPQCEMTNTKLKRKHSHRHQGSNNTLAIANSQGDVVNEDDINLPNRSEASTETPSKMTNMFKRIHSNKQEASKNVFKGIHDMYALMNGPNGDEWKMSRSARRKKAKKLFYRAHGLKKKMTDNKKIDHSSQNPSMPISHNSVEIQNPESSNQEEPSDYANADQNIDVNIHIAPVIVRPGHIRFESSGERSAPKDDPVDTFHWNGITSKKKGQKWGMEKSYYNWNNDSFNLLSCGESDAKGTGVIEVSNEKAAVEEVESHKDSIAEQVEPVIECDENSLSEEPEPQKQLINYESFLPLTRPPEDGDLLIYRVVELSSSWCPELSPFRVGRVSLYDRCSSKIILLPLPEYPRVSEETLDEGQESVGLYEEDGTLKIDFSSLVDVRLFKSPESEETTPNFAIEETAPNFPIEETTPNFPIEETTPNFPIEETTPNIPTEETTPNFPIEETTPHIPVEETTPSLPIEETTLTFPIEETQNDAPVNIQESEACSDQTANERHIGDCWEAIKLVLDEKKAQLEKQNKFDKRRDSSRSAETGPWSYKALRRNALGPTLAFLRSSSGD